MVTRLLGGSPAGTASFMRSWLLIEQPGPWAEGALEEALRAAFPPAQRARLERLRVSEGLRPLLIRRPGRHQRTSARTPRTVLVGSGVPGSRWLERLEVDELGELAGLDLDALAGGRGGFGTPVAGPVFVVCTHGTKDLCCALLGRPLVAALDANHPGRTWEASHVGGDRWAGNLLVVPDGFLHGQLSPDEAARVAKAALHGEVDPERLRGRTSERSRWAQHAEIALRRDLAGRESLRGVDDVLAVAVGEDSPTGKVSLTGDAQATAGTAGDLNPQHELEPPREDEDEPDGSPHRGDAHDQEAPEARTVTVRAGDLRYAVTVRRRSPDAQAPSRCTALIAPAGYTTEAITPAGSATPR